MPPPCLIDATRNDFQRVIGQNQLQRFRFVPWRAHPDVALFLGRQDHRHCLGMDRLDDRVWQRRQEAIDEVRAGDRF